MFKLQYKEDGIFIDTNYSNESLDEIHKYLESIREDGIIYRIYSAPYKDPKKTKIKTALQPQIIKEDKVNKANKVKIKLIKKIKLPKSKPKYLGRIHKGP